MTNQEKQKRFIEAGKNERKNFFHFLEQQKDFVINSISAPESKECWDVFYQSGDTQCLGEIKCRTFDLNKYSTALFKWDKFQRVGLRANDGYELGIVPMLISFYTDGVAVWNLDKVLEEYVDHKIKRRIVKYKAINIDEDSEEIENDCLFLPLNLATIYKKENHGNTN